MDIFPTIFDLIKINLEEEIDGVSIIPIIKGKNVKENVVYMEGYMSIKDNEIKKNIIGVRTSKYKYFRIREDLIKNVHLYDLEIDPLEETNIAKTNPEIKEKMEEILTQIQKNSKENIEFDEMTEEETKKIEEELKKLGYI